MDLLERAAHVVLISDLVARLAQAADSGTLEEYGALLAEDFTWEMPASPDIDLPAQVRTGRESALIGAQERRDAGIQGPGTGTFHVITTVSVDPGPDEATSMAYWHYYTHGREMPVLQSMGVYRDRFVRIDGTWLIASRQISRP
ncbi:nuclear transport factor 2 family protein [Nocardioides sp. Root151]|uniref:nuclear transport factor 2 family protein n=1 Tax=Nocardioides sp. Root151 TaxID=1736475 RepID=UPI000702CA90|nr:nuclear transport factor 2 family protein [Nocardioides sp. Root151]KQZ68708.1 hypothetical protein ASD66_15650 [Nocardioides sp. Root151]